MCVQQVGAAYEAIQRDYERVWYMHHDWVWDIICDAASDTCGPTIPGTTTNGWIDKGHLAAVATKRHTRAPQIPVHPSRAQRPNPSEHPVAGFPAGTRAR